MKTRKVERVRSFLGGQIIFNNQNSTLECQIRNISAAGAKLVLSSAVSLPEEFDLFVPQKAKTYRARLRWRLDEAAGVEFANAADSPEAGTDGNVELVKNLERENEILRRKVRELSERLHSFEGE